MSVTKAVFVLIHGGWHNHSAWDKVTPILKACGYTALTPDLPGAGVNAIAPTSLGRRPFDAAAFAAERSPVAGVTQEERAQAASQLHCDESNAGAVTPSGITSGRFGAAPRHYIRCTQDRATSLSGQDHMIAAVDGAIGGKTTTHTLESSHSPFLSQPVALSRILVDIAVQSLDERRSAVGLDT